MTEHLTEPLAVPTVHYREEDGSLSQVVRVSDLRALLGAQALTWPKGEPLSLFVVFGSARSGGISTDLGAAVAQARTMNRRGESSCVYEIRQDLSTLGKGTARHAWPYGKDWEPPSVSVAVRA